MKGSVPELGRCPGGGHGNPLQHSCQKNSMDRGASWAPAHRGHKESDTTKRLCIHTHTHTHVIPSLPIHLSTDIQVVSITGFCEQCCYEHKGVCIFLNYSFLWIYTQEWDCGIIWQLYFQFLEELPCCFPQWLQQFTFPGTLQKGSPFSTSSPGFVLCRLLMMAILMNVPQYPLTLKQLWLPKLFFQQESLQISAAKQAKLGTILGLSITKWNTQLGLSSKCENLLAFGHSPVHSSSYLFI